MNSRLCGDSRLGCPVERSSTSFWKQRRIAGPGLRPRLDRGGCFYVVRYKSLAREPCDLFIRINKLRKGGRVPQMKSMSCKFTDPERQYLGDIARGQATFLPVPATSPPGWPVSMPRRSRLSVLGDSRPSSVDSTRGSDRLWKACVFGVRRPGDLTAMESARQKSATF